MHARIFSFSSKIFGSLHNLLYFCLKIKMLWIEILALLIDNIKKEMIMAGMYVILGGVGVVACFLYFWSFFTPPHNGGGNPIPYPHWRYTFYPF